MLTSFDYDVFLSHSSKDKEIVRDLAKRLSKDGLRVWLDEEVIEPGTLIGLAIERGLQASRVLVLCMSENAFGSDWVRLERHTAIFRDPANDERRFIPVRLDDATIPELLRQYAYVDWRKRAREQYQKLRKACIAGNSDNSAKQATATQNENEGVIPVEDAGNAEGVAVTPDGTRIVSGSQGNMLRVWELASGRCLATLEGHSHYVKCVAVTPEGTRAVSGSQDNTLRVWELASGRCLATLEGHTRGVRSVAVTPDGTRAFSASDDGTLRVWELASGRCLATLEGHTKSVTGVTITADGTRAVSASLDHTLRVWELASVRCLVTHKVHEHGVRYVAVTPDGTRAIFTSYDSTLRVWELASGRFLTNLEGHTSYLWNMAVMPDGMRVVSTSQDRTLRVWELASGRCLATLEGHRGPVTGVAVTPDGTRAISASQDRTLRVWDITKMTAGSSQRYTNAKVLLVGESGVGKSGLAYRLTTSKFHSTISSDAAWATQLSLSPQSCDGDIEREVWLWDFAGQSDYRLIHQLFMDETALAIFVFNPQNENPFEGLGQWDRDITRAARRPFNKLLVAGRIDRGGLIVSRKSVEQFRKERGFKKYLETSAARGTGCDELKEAILKYIDWKEVPLTSSPRLFKVLKEAIIRLKNASHALLLLSELRQQLEMQLPTERFALDDLKTVVRLLSGPGVVWQMEFGDTVLIQPERINAYAAALVRKVRAHVDEIGSIFEEDVLAGNLDYQDMNRLPLAQERIVLRGMHQILVDHGLCLREHTEAGPLLVFPSYFKRERPDVAGHPAIFVTYQFSGALDEIYATLVVRLHNCMAFEKDRLWRFAADFKTPQGLRVGLKMTKKTEGAAEITVYLDPKTPEDTKVVFIKYVHEHLKRKALDVVWTRHYVCPNAECGEPIESIRALQKAIKENAQDLPCQFCRQPIPLHDLIDKKFASDEFERRVRDLEEKAGTNIDNESRELILVGHAFVIAGEAGQIFRPTPNSDWGIDGEIEFKDYDGNASGKRVYLQLKSGDSYLTERKKDDTEVFTIKNQRHADYWQQHEYPVMLVIRTSDGAIRWMNVSAYLKVKSKASKKPIKQVVFDGEPFTALNLQRLRDTLIPPPGSK